MSRVKTFTNGGSLLPGDLNSMEDDYELAFSTYKTITERMAACSTQAAGTYGLLFGNNGVGSATYSMHNVGFYFDPADWAAGTRTTKMRLKVQALTNAVAPTTNWTTGLYPAATFGGGSGSPPTIATLGSVIAGSTFAVNTPGATSQTVGTSGDFTAPAAGFYVLAVVNSGTAAVNFQITVRAELQVRQV